MSVIDNNKNISKASIQRLHHVGYVTNDIVLFEKFWCAILGFKKCFENNLPSSMMNDLFNVNMDAYVARYQREDLPEIEVHYFKGNVQNVDCNFNKIGINHICLYVNERERFLSELPPSISRKIYNNPGGWRNIFIQDFEGNWLELREHL